MAVALLAVSTILSFGWYHTHQQLLAAQGDLAVAGARSEAQVTAINESSSIIVELHGKINDLTDEISSDSSELAFWRDYAVIVTDAGIYHSYGCAELIDTDGFWIYNINIAKQLDLEPCDNCRHADGSAYQSQFFREKARGELIKID